MKNTISHDPVNSDFREVILKNKIIRLSKDPTGQITLIHLTNGEIIASNDSINTLEARINSDD